MKGIIYIVVLSVLLASCEKYEHKDVVLPVCNLCEFADSLNGHYRGKATGICSGCNDTLNYFIQHIFPPNLNMYEDSSIMYFSALSYFDSDTTNVTNETLKIDNSNGYVIVNGDNPTQDYEFYIRPDSMRLLNLIAVPSGGLPLIDALLYKQ